MKAVKYINPDGVEVEVPEADAPHFDKLGWPKAAKADEATKKSNKNKNNAEHQ